MYLKEEKALDLVEGAAHAIVIGSPLNRFVTIHMEKGEALDRAQVHTATYLRLVNQWLAYRGVQVAYLWVLEHVAGTGLHVHMIMHVPRHLWPEYKRRQKRWLQRADLKPIDGVIKDKRAGQRGMQWESQEDRAKYRASLTGLMRYLLEGIDGAAIASAGMPGQTVAEALRINPKPSVAIYGRRHSMSNNLRLKAREAYERPNKTA